MTTLNSPVPLFQAPLVTKAGNAVSAFQNWLVALYNKNSWSTFWEDLRFPATGINPTGAVGPMTFDTTNIGFLAAAASTQSIAMIAQMPHSWKEGTLIYPHIHWEPTTAGAGNVLWGMDYKWTNVGETEPVAWTTTGVVSAAGGAFKHQIASFPALDGSGKTISSILSIKIYRVGGDTLDTYGADALLKEFDIHYESDELGSRTSLSK